MDEAEQSQQIATASGREIAVPLNKLFRSPYNVRKKKGASIPELAALIESQTLLQNLVVHAERGKRKKTGRYGVVGGGRRLEALQLLHEQGKIPADVLVRCLEVSEDEAIAASLADNEREPLHPADQYEAFAAMHAAGKSSEQIAQAWGIDKIAVQRRLKLASVSPKLLDLYRDDGINLEQLMALTLAEDHETQESVWNSLPQYDRSAHTIRRMLTEREVDASRDPLARFVGVAAYEAAGGNVRRDLFALDGNSGFISNVSLLEKLVTERLQEQAKALKQEGWAWVEVRARFDNAVRRTFLSCRTIQRDPTAEQQARITELEALLADLEAKYETGEFEDEEALYEQQEKAEGEHSAIFESLREPHPDDQAIAGAVVYVGQDGQSAAARGMVRPEDRAARGSAAPGGSDAGEAEDGVGSIGGKPAGKPVYSERLMRQLTANRTAAIRASLADEPRIALCVLTFRLATQVFFGEDYERVDDSIGVRTDLVDLTRDASDLAETIAHQQIEEQRKRWGDALPGTKSALLAWLLGRGQDEVLSLLAFCTACTVNAVRSVEHPLPVADAIVSALKLEMADWWKPSRASYLGAVSKAKIIEAVTEGVSAGAANGMAAMNKDELVAAAEQALDGSGWLPTPLRAPAQ